ncbi:MAG: peptidoglycan DD-metalloendopeptidase family protein [Rhodoblastus sp.]
MCADKPLYGVRLGLRLLVATAVAAVLTGCSDATRLSSNPFSNPFETASSGPVDRMPTGTITPRAPSSSQMRIESKPLAPPTGSSALPPPVTSPQPVAPRPVASAPARGGAGLDHWSAEGGTPIVVAQGETAGALANRYGVPQDALLRVNGFNKSAQVQPGARLVVPVYHASAVRSSAPREETRKAEASKPEPRKIETRKIETRKIETRKPEPRKIETSRSKPSKEKYRLVKGAQPAAVKTARAEADDRKAEARKKAAEKKANEKKAAEKKAAEAKARADAAKLAREEKAKSRKQAEAARKTHQKQAALAPKESVDETSKSESRNVEAKKVEVDRETTASLPKEEPRTSGKEGHPEFRWPARGRVIQGFKSGGNDGINIAVPEGTAVKAAEGGVVKYAGSELKGYGNLVLIQHPNGYVSAYAHNGELDVKRGDTVKRGQTIAKAGQTGNVSSPQVHFELRKGSTPVDPTNYLAGL